MADNSQYTAFLNQMQGAQAGPQMGPLGGTPQPTPQTQLETLSEIIMKTLQQQEPQAPTAPPMQGMGGLQAAAAAMNPQTIPYFSQMANQPGQAQFAQQQAMFEKQMGDKRAALMAGANLTGRQIMANRPMAGTRLQYKQLNTTDAAGNPITIPGVYNPADGSIRAVSQDELDALTASGGVDRFVPPVIMPTITVGADGKPKAGFSKISKTDKPTTTVPGPDGSTIEPPPPPGMALEAGGKIGVLGRFKDLMDVFNSADTSVGGSSGFFNQSQNWVQNKLAGTSVGPILAPEQLVNYKRSVRAVLFPIVKATSGAVFPEAELARWESRFPSPGVDTPEEALHAWKVLIEEMTSDIQGKYGASGRTSPAIPNPLDSSSPKSRAEQLADEMGFNQ